MRIIAGKYKGRIFSPGKKFTSRPTTDKAREALFNILENRYDFSGMKILDLFSGTGSVGYEFLSRGAAEVTFVESDFKHFRFIREVSAKLGIDNMPIIKDDAFNYIKRTKSRYDIIFADPPFDAPFLKEIPAAVFNAGILKENGLLILEHPGNFNFSETLNFSEHRKYGKVNFSFFNA